MVDAANLTVEAISNLKYRELQSYAKAVGIRANQKSSVLAQKLKEYINSQKAEVVLDEVKPEPEEPKSQLKVTQASPERLTPEAARSKTRTEWFQEAQRLEQENLQLRADLDAAREAARKPRRLSTRKQWGKMSVEIGDKGIVITPRGSKKTKSRTAKSVAAPNENTAPRGTNKPRFAKKVKISAKKGGKNTSAVRVKRAVPGEMPAVVTKRKKSTIAAGKGPQKRRKFDLSASLKRPITWKMKKKPYKFSGKGGKK